MATPFTITIIAASDATIIIRGSRVRDKRVRDKRERRAKGPGQPAAIIMMKKFFIIIILGSRVRDRRGEQGPRCCVN